MQSGEMWRDRLTRSFVAFVVLMFLAVSPAFAAGKADKGKGKAAKGTFKLVGTGPGDADLLTPRAVKAIREADLVFCDPRTKEKLEPYVDFKDKKVLDGYGRLFPFYGKDCSKLTEEEKAKESMSCEEYHKKQSEFASLVRKAVATGKKVALTSSGDPTIYGPSMWTMEALADLKPTVVPGLSSFNAANAALQVSLGEVIITAPFKKEGHKDSLESLAAHDRATMVIFMPRDLNDLFTRLSSVYPAEAPVGIVSSAGSVASQKVVTGSIGSIREKLGQVDPKMSLIYVGKAIGDAQFKPEPTNSGGKAGKYYLVGMGPGDPDLATLRALDVIKKADLIFAGRGISEKFATELKDKQVIDGYHRIFPFYGKDCSKLSEEEKAREGMSCEEYQKKQSEFAGMVRKAVGEGKTVAMLDNGDPLVYGPCSWSLKELRDLDTEVTPGLSCFNAANAALGDKVTEGKDSHSIIFASGWSVEEMAAHRATMVLFTMRTEFKKFIESLSKHYSPETPVAIVMNAGYAEKEGVMRGKLGTILAQVGESKLPFEYMLYVGSFLKE